MKKALHFVGCVMEDLKKCPFCGGQVSYSFLIYMGVETVHAECNVCHSRSDEHKTWRGVADAWNRRV